MSSGSDGFLTTASVSQAKETQARDALFRSLSENHKGVSDRTVSEGGTYGHLKA